MNVWCGICATYGAHDTAHHDAGPGGFVPGDRVQVKDSNVEHAGKKGRVEQVRGAEALLAIAGRSGTTSVSIPVSDLESFVG